MSYPYDNGYDDSDFDVTSADVDNTEQEIVEAPQEYYVYNDHDFVDDTPVAEPEKKNWVPIIASSVVAAALIGSAFYVYGKMGGFSDRQSATSTTSSAVTVTSTVLSEDDIQRLLDQERMQRLEKELEETREDYNKAVEDVTKLKEANEKIAEEYKEEKEGENNSRQSSSRSTPEPAPVTTVTQQQTAPVVQAPVITQTEPQQQAPAQTPTTPSPAETTQSEPVDSLIDLFR